MRLLTVAALCLIVTPLAAQRTDTTARRGTRADSATKPVLLPPVLVTGTLSPFPTAMVGISRSVISADALRAEPMRAMIEPLRNAPSVFIDEANGPLGPTIIRLRGGEETFTQILFDGVQANENGGFFDAQGLTLSNVDRIEVARGPQSAIYGSSAMSGVVQLFTRAGRPGPLRADAALEGGRTSTYGGSMRGLAEVSGGSERMLYSIGGGRTSERGPYRLPHDLEANDASMRLDLLPQGPFKLTGIVRYMGVDSKLPVRNPGVTRAPLDPNQRQGRERVLGSMEAAWTPSDRWNNVVTLSGYHRGFTYDDTKDNLDPTQFSFFVPDFNFHYNAVVRRATGRYVGTVRGAPSGAGHESVHLTLAYGGQWERETLRDTANGDFGPSHSSIGRNSVAGFAELQGNFHERVSVLLGSRVEKFGGLGAEFVPRATAAVTVVPDRVALRAAVGRAYKAPNIQDQFNSFLVPNPDLQPERSSSWELATDLSASRARGSIAVFRQDYTNLIRSVDANAGGKQTNRNIGKSRATGLEVDAEVTPRPRWLVGAEAAWLATRVIDNKGLPADQFPNDEPLPFRPTYTTSGFVQLPATSALSLAFRVTGIGRQIVLTERFRGSRASIDPYAVAMATATYVFRGSLETYLHLENAFDANYETAYDRPGSPRSITLGLRAKR